MPITQGEIIKLEEKESKNGKYLVMEIRGIAEPFSIWDPDEWQGKKVGDKVSFSWTPRGIFQNVDSGSLGIDIATDPRTLEEGSKEPGPTPDILSTQERITRGMCFNGAIGALGNTVDESEIFAKAKRLLDKGKEVGYW